MNENISKYIFDAPTEQRNIMETIREIIHIEVPYCIENFKWGRPIFSTKDDLIYFKSEKKYFTLGFFNFHKIINNANLLEGTGKNMRHIKIKNINDLNIDIVRDMIKQVSK